ncbi:MAG: hypothetical protein NTY35_06010 [Planctomycetota bacterium]|nr:hypothetical protein [Planctomycetota bacterium]
MPRRPVSSLARGIHHALLCAALTACASNRPPDLRQAVDTAWGTVRAARRDDAVEIALVVERVAPRVAAAIPSRGTAALDIRLVPELARAHWGGATITTAEERWIELPEDGRDIAAQAILAHELVHFWLAGEWKALPPVLEEGLAIHVAHLAVPQAAPRERGELALVLGTLLDGSVTFDGPGVAHGPAGAKLTPDRARYTMHARIDAGELPPLGDIFNLEADELARSSAPGVRAVLDALAYVVMERIGVEKLHRLCVQAGVLGHARIPSEWIWTAARIDPNEPVSLQRAVLEMLGTPEIRALLLRDDLRIGAHGDDSP